MASFWEGLLPGMIQTGAGMYSEKLARDEAQKRLQAAQGPLYQKMQGMAGKSLGMAGSMDPKAMAAERFAAQQALIEPSNKAKEQEVLRRLQKTGMLGVSSFAPVPGTTPTPGVAMNPHLAALYAAQEGAKSRAAYESLGEGERYLDQLIQRGGMLSGRAQTQREGDYAAQSVVPPRPSTLERAVKIGGQVFSKPENIQKAVGIAKQLPGMLGKAGDWIGGLFGGGGSSAPAPAYNYDFDGLFNF
jgi:hypothetical protein